MKIVIIDNNQIYSDIISGYMEYLGEEFYPKNVEEFITFRSNILCSFSHREKVAKESLEEVLLRIDDFKNGDKDVVYLLELELSNDEPDINGLALCKKIFPEKIEGRVIFISDTSNVDQLKRINDFIVDNSNCYFISKKSRTFIQMLLKNICTR